MIESQEDKKCKKIGDPNGYCVSWCIWYCYNKILNLDIPSDELVQKLIKFLTKEHYQSLGEKKSIIQLTVES